MGIEHALDTAIITAPEARGLISGGAVAHQVSTAFVPMLKKGRLYCRDFCPQ